MIGVGIVGCNYGRTVLIPAFRQDPRCEVVALAGTDTARAAELARAANVARGLGSWQAMVEEPAVAVIAVAVPPDLQPAIAQRALDLGKPVFLEKPLAADLAGARAILESARKSARPTIVDFNFPELPSWRRPARRGSMCVPLRNRNPSRVRFRGRSVPLGGAAEPSWQFLLRR